MIKLNKSTSAIRRLLKSLHIQALLLRSCMGNRTSTKWRYSERTTWIEWRIDDFLQRASLENPSVVLTSRQFNLDVSGERFCLQFHPTNQENSGSRQFCSVFVCSKQIKKKSRKEHMRIRLKFWLQNKDGDLIGKPIESEPLFTGANQVFGHAQFIHHNEIYPPHSRFVRDNVIFVCCRISRRLVEDDVPGPLKSETMLRRKMWLLQTTGTSDFCIIRIGDRKFNVSKSVLMIQSKEFNRIFLSTDSNESVHDQFTINDIRPEVFEALLQYVYLGEAERMREFPEELFLAANRYGITNLKKDCLECIERTYNGSNSFERLKLAFSCKNRDLAKLAVDYVTQSDVDGNFKMIRMTSDWDQLRSEHLLLANEIMEAIYDRKNY